MDGQLFPKGLLLKSANEKIDYFKNLTVAHPHLIKTYEEFKNKISVADKNEILLIFGPSGVGKSTLFNRVIEDYNKTYLTEMLNDKGIIPIVGTEAIAPDDGRFDWKDFYIRSLSSLNEPLINYKINNEVYSKGIMPTDKSKNAYRRAMENALIYRKPYAFLIDEAQHISRIARGKSLRNQMDTLKSLASISMVPFVLFGTYEVLKFRNLSGQLIRRGIDIHLPRYKVDIADDRDSFQNVLWTFQKHLPFINEPNLIDHWEYFYMHSIGCVGNMKLWFNRTLDHSLSNDMKKKTLTINDFEKFELSLEKVEKMVDEAIEMEKYVEDSDSENERRNRVSIKLGMGCNQSEEKGTSHKSSKQRGRVGERKPNRDQVGVDEYKDAKINS